MNREEAFIILPTWLITTPLDPPKYQYGIRICGAEITHVEPNADLEKVFPNEQRINAEGKLLAPGFVYTHTHMYGVLAHASP